MKILNIAIFLLIISSFAEGIEFRGELEKSEKLFRYKSVLNPGKTGVEEGLSGSLNWNMDIQEEYKNLKLYVSAEGALNIDKMGNTSHTGRTKEWYAALQTGDIFLDAGKKRERGSIAFLKSIIDTDGDWRTKEESEGEAGFFITVITDGGGLKGGYIPALDERRLKIGKELLKSQNEYGYIEYGGTWNTIEYKGKGMFGAEKKGGGNISASFFENSLILYMEGAVTSEINCNRINESEYGYLYMENEKVSNSLELAAGGNFGAGDFDIRWEYLYNSYGYSSKKWKKIIEKIKETNDMADAEMKNANMGTAALFLKGRELSTTQNYGMIRGEYNGFKKEKIELVVTLICNFDDMGANIIGESGIEIGKSTTLKLEATKSLGGKYTEFKMAGLNYTINSSLKYSF